MINMKAEVKGFHSPDINDLEKFIPDIEDNFSFLLQIFVGTSGKEGEESFDVLICTPKWIQGNYKEDDIILGIHKIIVFKYDFNSLKRRLEKSINTITGDNWEEIANKIGRIGKWEFEDYEADSNKK